jgi:hypothetical protein
MALTNSIEEIKGHPKGPAYHIDFVDPRCPNGKPLNFRFQTSANGLRAIREAIDLILEERKKPLIRASVRESVDHPVVLYPNSKEEEV